MLAVVKIAGQQFKVQAGDSLYVPHLQGKTGDKVEFNDVLFVDNNGSISFATKAVVKA
jgi:large subunit ribosomal protein L21